MGDLSEKQKRAALEQMASEGRMYKELYYSMVDSNSFKFTKPIRAFANVLRRLCGKPPKVLFDLRKSQPLVPMTGNGDSSYSYEDIKFYIEGAVEAFEQLLAGKRVVSFDIFDTLLIRPFVEPTDLFRLMEEQEKAPGFAEERIAAEVRTRRLVKQPDITLEEIYSNIKPCFKDFLKRELAYETELLQPNPFVLQLYKLAKQKGLQVVATSDMYLGEEFLLQILIAKGYKGLKKVYVSSELRKTKGSGELFDYVLKDLNFSASQVVHIGDNSISDYEVPLGKGLGAHRVLPLVEIFKLAGDYKWFNYYNENRTLSSSVFLAQLAYFTVKNYAQELSYWQRLGYALGGPLVTGYLQFVLQETQRNRIDRLLFVARDSWSLIRLYEKYLQGKGQPDGSYVYLQRILGIKGLLEWSEEPRYLKKLLTMAKAEGVAVEVSEDFEANKQELSRKLEALKEWAEPCYKELEQHLKQASGEGQNIALVDTTTGAFSSYRFAKDILGERLQLGIFTGSFMKNEHMVYSSFLNRTLTGADERDIIMAELLISSPENNVVGLKDNLPVYQDEDNAERSQIYMEIYAGVEAYMADNLQQLGKLAPICSFGMEEWLELCEYYYHFAAINDREALQRLNHYDYFMEQENRNFANLL